MLQIWNFFTVNVFVSETNDQHIRIHTSNNEMRWIFKGLLLRKFCELFRHLQNYFQWKCFDTWPHICALTAKASMDSIARLRWQIRKECSPVRYFQSSCCWQLQARADDSVWQCILDRTRLVWHAHSALHVHGLAANLRNFGGLWMKYAPKREQWLPVPT